MTVLLSSLAINSIFRFESEYQKGIFRYIGRDEGNWLVCDTLAHVEKDGSLKVNHPSYYEVKYFYGTEMVEPGTFTTSHQFISHEEMNRPKTTERNARFMSEVFNASYSDAGLTKQLRPVEECYSVFQAIAEEYNFPYPGPMNGDRLEYEIENKDVAPEDRPDWPLPSFDAQDWAKAFIKIYNKLKQENNADPMDEGWMISWFANSLMRGFDEGVAKTAGVLIEDDVTKEGIAILKKEADEVMKNRNFYEYKDTSIVLSRCDYDKLTSD